MKRAAFQRKQRALRDALAIGDRLARCRRAELGAACFGAWRARARVRGAAGRRCAAVRARMLRSAWHCWRAFLPMQVTSLAALL